MGDERRQRAMWIAAHVLPAEPALRRWLSYKIRNVYGIEVDDIVQETYAVLGALASIDQIRSPRNYVFQVAYSIVVKHYRRCKIIPIDYFVDLDRFDVASERPSPEIEASGRQELLYLGQLIADLPTRQRQAFKLLKLEGLSQREAANRMSISENTIEKHIAKALFTLTRKLGRGGNAPTCASIYPDEITEAKIGEPTRNKRRD